MIARLTHCLLGPHADTLAPDAREREVIAAFKVWRMLLILANYETFLTILEASTSEVKKDSRTSAISGKG
jgi:hypothetical protein